MLDLTRGNLKVLTAELGALLPRLVNNGDITRDQSETMARGAADAWRAAEDSKDEDKDFYRLILKQLEPVLKLTTLFPALDKHSDPEVLAHYEHCLWLLEAVDTSAREHYIDFHELGFTHRKDFLRTWVNDLNISLRILENLLSETTEVAASEKLKYYIAEIYDKMIAPEYLPNDGLTVKIETMAVVENFLFKLLSEHLFPSPITAELHHMQDTLIAYAPQNITTNLETSINNARKKQRQFFSKYLADQLPLLEKTFDEMKTENLFDPGGTEKITNVLKYTRKTLNNVVWQGDDYELQAGGAKAIVHYLAGILPELNFNPAIANSTSFKTQQQVEVFLSTLEKIAKTAELQYADQPITIDSKPFRHPFNDMLDSWLTRIIHLEAELKDKDAYKNVRVLANNVIVT